MHALMSHDTLITGHMFARSAPTKLIPALRTCKVCRRTHLIFDPDLAKMAPTATMEVGQDGVAVITLANPPVNALHPNGAPHCLDTSELRAVIVM